ncbi:DUF4870 domain-containing protein [Calothrix sp. CCY 0018]|uniref:DUF4870 domain-containing protein n=1 Tax=Calothrix sp. CCY 0018 TaxID=3103864 RepID=UPI0039C696E9
MYDTDSRKLLSALCHGAIFLNFIVVPIAIPIVIFFITQDPVVKDNAKEALIFYLNVWLCGIIIGVLVSVTFGLLWPLVPAWFVVHWGLTIWALSHVLGDSEKPFRYPFIFRVI